MKKNSGLLKFIITTSLVMGGLTVFLLYTSVAQERNNQSISIDMDTINLVQLDEPHEGEPVATVETTLGSFSFVLYPQYSPNAVKNFIELAESGYYDNTYVFNSESGVYSSMGSKLKNGDLPEEYDLSRELVERELNQDLWPFKGAVCSLTTSVDKSFKEKVFGGGTYFNGSRFAVLNTVEFTDEEKEELKGGLENNIIADAFIEKGGIPNFSQQMTVIGQTYEGLDVVETLSSLETQDSGVYKVPKEDIMIISVRIGVYTSENE